MSHQTGIHSNAELLECLKKCRSDNLKFQAIQISIENEQLNLSKIYEELDLSRLKEIIDREHGCYIFYRLNDSHNRWFMITWAPEVAAVREKMLYASTKATMKLEFGTTLIVNDMHCTTVEDLVSVPETLRSEGVDLTNYMSDKEMEQMERKQDQAKFSVEHGVNSRTQTLTSLAIPLSSDLVKSLSDWSQNLDEEKVKLTKRKHISIEDLPKNVPKEGACYHLFNFVHEHDGHLLSNTNVFIYSMSGYNNCSIKERMLYSSCKNYLVEQIEAKGVNISKKLEIESGDELTEQFLKDELHPTIVKQTHCFEKPKGPPNRGARRIIK